MNKELEENKTITQDTNFRLYKVFSAIPLDVEGSNIANTGWIPTDLDKQYMDNESIDKSIKEGVEKNAKVLFKNVSLSWDSCDCGDGFGCPHGNYVYEIDITNGDKTHTLEMDDSGIIAYNERNQASIPEKESTIYDFYRMCELVGIKLELSDYALILINTSL
jgi:hypothetical protein